MLLNWALMLMFVVIGVLNILKVDVLTGVAYLLLSIIYFPSFDNSFRKYLGFTIPYLIKIILAFLVIWGSLAVGDLAKNIWTIN